MKVTVRTLKENGVMSRQTETEFMGQIIRMKARAGDKPAEWSDDMHHYRCTLKNRNTSAKMAIDFWVGAAWEKAPHVADVLDCLIADASLVDEQVTFEDYAAELGENPDSRKAHATWRAVVREAARLKKWLGDSYDAFLENWPRDWEEETTGAYPIPPRKIGYD